MKKIITILVIFPVLCFSQESVERPDITIEPDPYRSTYFENKNDYEKIARITTIVKNSYNNFKNDTLQIVFYNKAGKKERTIRYSNNLQTASVYFEYYLTGKIKSWRNVEKKSTTLTLYSYDRNGRVDILKQYLIRSINDTSLLHKQEFKYGAEGLIQIIHSGGHNIIEKFEYQANKLQFKTGGPISKKIEYDTEGNVVKITKYMGGEIRPEQAMELKIFKYDDINLLVADSVSTSYNITPGDFAITNYHYDGQILKSLNIYYKNFYSFIYFEYDHNNRIKEVNISTNSNNAYLRHWINHKVEEFYIFPIKYKEIFEYDIYGNRTSMKIYVNNELFSEVNYQIEYQNP